MGCRFGREEFHVISVCGEAGRTLRDAGAIDERESFIDARFSAANGYAEGRSPMRYSGSGLR